jgi:hypothetical protein
MEMVCEPTEVQTIPSGDEKPSNELPVRTTFSFPQCLRDVGRPGHSSGK